MVDVTLLKRNQPIAHLAIVSGNSDSDDAFAADDRVHKHKKKNKLKLNSSRSSKIRSKPISEGPSFIKIKEIPANSSKYPDEIDLSATEPDLLAHGISSQETIIVSSCESITNSNLTNESMRVEGNDDSEYLESSSHRIKELPTKKLDIDGYNLEVLDFDNKPINKNSFQKEALKRRTENEGTELKAKRLKSGRNQIPEEKSETCTVTVPKESTKFPISQHYSERINKTELTAKSLKLDGIEVPEEKSEPCKATVLEEFTKFPMASLQNSVMKDKTELVSRWLESDGNEIQDEESDPDKATVLNEPTKFRTLSPQNPVRNDRNSVSSHLSPALGLRLGLSRNRRTSKPLHPAIKFKDC